MALAANQKTALQAFGLVAFMVALSFASVPLYDLFCRVTGFGGTTLTAKAPPATSAVLAASIDVGFVSFVAPELPWDFSPGQRRVSLKIGEPKEVTYRVTNHANEPLVGMATYNVQPEKAGAYFNKVQCFCFAEQLLQPGQVAEYPVVFFVDPAIADDPAMADVHEITLSYTFFLAKDQSKAKQRVSGRELPTLIATP